MSTTGTTFLWSCAPSGDHPEFPNRPTAVWAYYSHVAVASPHCRVAGGAEVDDLVAENTDAAPAQKTVELATVRRGRLAEGSSRSEIREWGPWSLTQRELEVLQLLAEGATNGEISQRLFISTKTAKNHLAAIFQKLEVGNRTQALVRAVVMGLVNIE